MRQITADEIYSFAPGDEMILHCLGSSPEIRGKVPVRPNVIMIHWLLESETKYNIPALNWKVVRISYCIELKAIHVIWYEKLPTLSGYVVLQFSNVLQNYLICQV